MVEALGLKNITLRQLDITGVGRDWGEFDYIIAHGLYSWVPAAVEDKILDICQANLAPNGVAFVSYNAHPGGHIRNMVREMMLFHVRRFASAEEQVSQGLAAVRALANSLPESDLYRQLLEKELQTLTRRDPAAVYHDDLAPINNPIYFYQFTERAREHGLQYLAEADFSAMQAARFTESVADALRRLEDVIVKEQFMDFLKCRKFRQTLLCHRDIPLDRALKPERVRSLYVASSARPLSSEPSIRSTSTEGFRIADGRTASTNHPLTKAALSHLAAHWPRPISFAELLKGAQARLGPDTGQDDESASCLAETVLGMYAADTVDLHVHVPRFLAEPSERPVVSPLARLQLQEGSIVTTMRHTSVDLESSLLRHLLLLLDGTRDRSALVRELAEFLVTGEGTAEPGGKPVSSIDDAQKLIAESLEHNLLKAADLALLVA